MTQTNHTSDDASSNKERRQSSQTSQTSEIIRPNAVPLPINQLPASMSFQGQAAQLSSAQLPLLQRQLMGAALAERHGNQHMVQVMQMLRPTAAPSVIQRQGTVADEADGVQSDLEMATRLETPSVADYSPMPEATSPRPDMQNMVTQALMAAHPPKQDLPGRAEKLGVLQMPVEGTSFEGGFENNLSQKRLDEAGNALTFAGEAEQVVSTLTPPTVDRLDNRVSDEVEALRGLSPGQFVAARASYQEQLPALQGEMQKQVLETPLSVPTQPYAPIPERVDESVQAQMDKVGSLNVASLGPVTKDAEGVDDQDDYQAFMAAEETHKAASEANYAAEYPDRAQIHANVPTYFGPRPKVDLTGPRDPHRLLDEQVAADRATATHFAGVEDAIALNPIEQSLTVPSLEAATLTVEEMMGTAGGRLLAEGEVESPTEAEGGKPTPGIIHPEREQMTDEVQKGYDEAHQGYTSQAEMVFAASQERLLAEMNTLNEGMGDIQQETEAQLTAHHQTWQAEQTDLKLGYGAEMTVLREETQNHCGQMINTGEADIAENMTRAEGEAQQLKVAGETRAANRLAAANGKANERLGEVGLGLDGRYEANAVQAIQRKDEEYAGVDPEAEAEEARRKAQAELDAAVAEASRIIEEIEAKVQALLVAIQRENAQAMERLQQDIEDLMNDYEAKVAEINEAVTAEVTTVALDYLNNKGEEYGVARTLLDKIVTPYVGFLGMNGRGLLPYEDPDLLDNLRALLRIAPPPNLYVLGRGDNLAIHASDVDQGLTGDCYFLASIATIAEQNPAVLRDLIQPNPDGSYTVTLYEEQDGQLVPIQVAVDAANIDPNGALPGDGGENWTQILELAFAESRGGYKAIEGGWGYQGMTTLTGEESEAYTTSWMGFEHLAYLHEEGYGLTVGTSIDYQGPGFNIPDASDKASAEYGMLPQHEYFISEVNEADQTVTLRNPWEWAEPEIVIPFEDLQDYTRTVSANPIEERIPEPGPEPVPVPTPNSPTPEGTPSPGPQPEPDSTPEPEED